MKNIVSVGVAAVWIGLLVATGAGGERSPAPTTLRALYGAKPIERIPRPQTAVVLVDFQRELFEGFLRVDGGDGAVARASELVAWARREGVLVVHVRNVVPREDSPIFGKGSPLLAFVSALTPREGEPVVTKSMAGAFSKTELDALLRGRGISTVIVAGVMTHLAVDTTARDATVLGYRVLVASDACATRALPAVGGGDPVDAVTVHRVALAALADRFAEIASVESIVRRPVD